eukprot:TRINITY_DN16140_c0_g1_i1.p1 TRINITY_DN16140_c0_g1~~TRINITY_DN16140_c0_g1_i1.p1  ORF type:complete len:417 (-),score=55.09 TRINITY_DN16140_c0_g1_i1:79-1329(-)
MVQFLTMMANLPQQASIEVVVALAILANSILVLAPVSFIIKVFRGEPGRQDLTGALLTTFLLLGQCLMWTCYSATGGLRVIAGTNAVGACLCILYMATLSWAARRDQTLRAAIGFCMAGLGFFCLCIICRLPTVQQRQFAFAGSAIAFCILQSLSPMRQVLVGIIMGSRHEFPIFFTVTSFCSSLLWAQYATVVGDNFYYYGNAAGAIASCLQLSAYAFVTSISRPLPEGEKAKMWRQSVAERNKVLWLQGFPATSTSRKYLESPTTTSFSGMAASVAMQAASSRCPHEGHRGGGDEAGCVGFGREETLKSRPTCETLETPQAQSCGTKNHHGSSIPKLQSPFGEVQRSVEDADHIATDELPFMSEADVVQRSLWAETRPLENAVGIEPCVIFPGVRRGSSSCVDIESMGKAVCVM